MMVFSADHAFEGPDGPGKLPDLFEGRRQLIVHHFWFLPEEEPCNGCSMFVKDGIRGARAVRIAGGPDLQGC